MNKNINENQKTVEVNEIEKSLNYLHPEYKSEELRTIVKTNGNYTKAGYFSDHLKMAEESAQISEYAEGVYFILNPIKAELHDRCDNRTHKGLNPTTCDADIDHRDWLLIDCDPVRTSGVSATDIEKDYALTKAHQVRNYLNGKGLPKPVFADSGNGAHLLYRIDLPAKDDGLVKRILENLANRFDDERVHVDKGVYNPARICKLYGTLARKGDNTIDRPHRLSGIIWDESPEHFELVTCEQLEEVAGPKPVKGINAKQAKSNSNFFNLTAWISKHELDVTGPKDFVSNLDGEHGQKWVFNTCPWNSDHTDRSAWILQLSSGAISAGCQHAGCQGNDWQSLRNLYESKTKTGSDFALTDLGNAERLVNRHGDNIRYSPERNAWFIWNGKYWALDTKKEIMLLAHATVRNIYADASNITNDAKREDTVKWGLKSESKEHLKAMVELAEPLVPIMMQEMDLDTFLLNCQNGTIDLRTGVLLNHSKDHFITRVIPLEYKGRDYTSNLWNKVLLDWSGKDQALVNFLQQAVGYSICGDTREEVLFFLYGPGASGKSSFISAIKNTLGEYTRTADFETFLKRSSTGGPRNDIARLAGSRMVISIEVEKGQKLAEALVKTITGNDTVTCRFLYKESFESKPTFKLWLVANDAPGIDPDDDAIMRRILRIPFDQSIPKENRNTNLKYELATPVVLSAILTWAVNGCIKWQKDGLAIPEKVRASTEEYRTEVDPLKAFFEEMTVIDPKNLDYTERTVTILDAYNRWAKSYGETQLLSHKPLTDKMRSLGCQPIFGRKFGDQIGIQLRGPARGWQGITLR